MLSAFGVVCFVGMPFKDFGNGNEKLQSIIKEKDLTRKSPANSISKYISDGWERLVLNALF